MLITPIKPNIFPHSAMPSTRPKGADIMTKSLNVRGENGSSVLDMSKSLASFHLTSANANAKNPKMDQSVDQLFKEKPHQYSHSNNNKHKESPHSHGGPAGTAATAVIAQEQQRLSGDTRGFGGNIKRPAPPQGPPRFLPVCTVEDVQAIRCAEFHPNGSLFAVGSNSKTLRICQYPHLGDLREDHEAFQAQVLFKRNKHHKGSIYCLAWNPTGDLIATGSNDKTVKMMRFSPEGMMMEGTGQEMELTMHDGTVRDVTFMNDRLTLVSAGAGDCKIYLTDCVSGQPMASLVGHGGHVLSVSPFGSYMVQT